MWTAGALTAAGLAALALAFLWQDKGYWSSVLIEVGAAIVLLVPLFLIQQRFERRQEQLSERIEDVAQRVEALRLDQLDEATQARVEQATQQDEALFDAFKEAPSFDTAYALLRRAVQLNAISKRGIRVPIRGHHVRDLATLRLRLYEGLGSIWVRIEDRDGQQQGRELHWSHGEPVDALMGEVVTVLQSMDLYSPGVFRPEEILEQFLDTLRLAIESRTGVNPFKIQEPVIELPSDDWIITTSALRHLKSDIVVFQEEMYKKGHSELTRELMERADIKQGTLRPRYCDLDARS
jgi:hypothetical protein